MVMRQTFNLTGDGFESLHFYQIRPLTEEHMRGWKHPLNQFSTKGQLIMVQSQIR